jgi:type II secretory ATPase GspE/PulE/Tfp pilus assembly ATPase PilB-like protein
MAKKTAIVIPDITIEASGIDQEEQEANLATVTASPGFPNLAVMLVDLIARRVDIALFDFTPQIVVIKYQIDGVWHDMPTMDREAGDYMLAALKQLAGTDYRERRRHQEGNFRAAWEYQKVRLRVVSQGIKIGERVGVYVERKKPPVDNLEQMGMRKGLRDELKKYVDADEGLVVVGALPGEGFTTAWRGVLGAADRFLRDYFVVEDKSRVEKEVINVQSETYDGQRQWIGDILPGLLLREPHAIGFTELPDARSLDTMSNLVIQNHLMVVTRIFTRHAVETLPRLLALKPKVEELLEALKCIVCMRLVRRLCESCRIAFEPHPDLLQKLGIPPGRVRQLYRPFILQPGAVDEKGQPIPACPQCFGIGYRERTGVFELLKITEPIKMAVRQQPQLDTLMKVAQASGHISMRDEAVLLVAQGITSVEEIQRVFAKKG